MPNNLSVEEIRRLFLYEPETGRFLNRIDRPHAKAGILAGCPNIQGYWYVKVHGTRYPVTHLIWVWMTRTWPEAEVDHENLKPGDNRWNNLRDATRSEQCINKGRYARPNRFGLRGVKQISKDRYAATICTKQVEKYLGPFSTPELAALAYDVEAKKQHGEFARLNYPEKAHRDWLIV